jgi:hypothetical protein
LTTPPPPGVKKWLKLPHEQGGQSDLIWRRGMKQLALPSSRRRLNSPLMSGRKVEVNALLMGWAGLATPGSKNEETNTPSLGGRKRGEVRLIPSLTGEVGWKRGATHFFQGGCQRILYTAYAVT